MLLLDIGLVVATTHSSYIGLSNFFFLNLFFLVNSELITNIVVLLSNNISTTIPSLLSFYFNPIFIITSLNKFSVSFYFPSALIKQLLDSIFYISTSFFDFYSLKVIFLSFFISPSLSSYMFITLPLSTSNLFKDLCCGNH